MKKIDIYTGEWLDDVRRIQKILLENDYEATLQECESLWNAYSDSMCAGWMMLDDIDYNVYMNISHYINN